MSTINQMDCEEVFLSALGRCWRGFDIFENDPLQYQIYTYEVWIDSYCQQCNAIVVSCCGKYLIAGIANHIIPIGKVKTIVIISLLFYVQVFSLRDAIEEEFHKLNVV